MSNLVLLLVVLPFVVALAIYLIRASAIRSALVMLTGGVLAVASIVLLAKGLTHDFQSLPTTVLGISWDTVITVADFALLGIIFFYGLRLKSTLILLFTAAQVVLLGIFELFVLEKGTSFSPLYTDSLSLVMVLIISIVGSIVCIYGLPYMRIHEEHRQHAGQLTGSRQPEFFFYMILFLGGMNGLVLSRNMLWLYFFFEVTTFCSFMLIQHDRTEEAIRNATRALWMNSLGGLAFVVGLMIAYGQLNTIDVLKIVESSAPTGLLLGGLGLLVVAGFTKAAQVPFQSWLLGAMVAPTPVSALLHSSTMVKAGVYVVLRFAPAFADTALSTGLAICGGFTFLACAALAIGQSNGKRILAYSTVSNLGLILACAGINTQAAFTAAILLIIFHALSKGLLFLCVGTIEQEIGSRNVEDMRGLFNRMPRTAVITITGILSMLLPPFGVLVSKWLAIQASAQNVVVVTLVALGSALTVVYWARWAGLLMGSRKAGTPWEKQPALTVGSLVALCGAVVVLSLLTPVVYGEMILPMFEAMPALGSDVSLQVTSGGILGGPMGAFAVYPVFIVLAVGTLAAVFFMRRTGRTRYTYPYMSGLQVGEPDSGAFTGPMNQPVSSELGNYYLSAIFGESRLTRYVNFAAIALILLMMGLAMKGGVLS
jgi:ech hydrogenase subunit A